MSKITAIVLAGGQSRRFGRDKAMAIIPGMETSFLAYVVAVAGAVADRTMIVAPARFGYSAHGEVVADRYPGEGPAGGLITGLMSCEPGLAILLAVDQVAVRPDELRRLVDGAMGYEGAVFENADGQISPFPCVLDVVATRQALTARFADGERSLRGIIAPLRLAKVSIDSNDPDRLMDVDTVEELNRLSGDDERS